MVPITFKPAKYSIHNPFANMKKNVIGDEGNLMNTSYKSANLKEKLKDSAEYTKIMQRTVTIQTTGSSLHFCYLKVESKSK
jgi:hypothetical protein